MIVIGVAAEAYLPAQDGLMQGVRTAQRRRDIRHDSWLKREFSLALPLHEILETAQISTDWAAMRELMWIVRH